MSSVVNQTFFSPLHNLQELAKHTDFPTCMNISHSEQLSKVNALQDNVISNVDFKYSLVRYHAG